mgnify:CR=1 FL=1
MNRITILTFILSSSLYSGAFIGVVTDNSNGTPVIDANIIYTDGISRGATTNEKGFKNLPNKIFKHPVDKVKALLKNKCDHIKQFSNCDGFVTRGKAEDTQGLQARCRVPPPAPNIATDLLSLSSHLVAPPTITSSLPGVVEGLYTGSFLSSIVPSSGMAGQPRVGLIMKRENKEDILDYCPLTSAETERTTQNNYRLNQNYANET